MMRKKARNTRMARQERLLGLFMFLASLFYYLWGTSWTVFPGKPAWMLLSHLEPDATIALDPIWGWLICGMARLPGLPVSGWAGLFSAVCGAWSVALLARLMMHTDYHLPDNAPPTYAAQEIRARLISALVAGFYLAGCIPFGIASTRSLPLSFHILMLLFTAWFFSKYQRCGQLRYLSLTGVLYGLGLAEFPTFLVLLPVAVMLLLREMYLWRVLGSRRVHLTFWGSLLLGLMVIPFQTAVFWREGMKAGQILTCLDALKHVVWDPIRLLTRLRFTDGFTVIVFFASVPWLVLFAMSNRSPWTYDGSKTGIRLLLAGGILGVLLNAPYSPWSLLGMSIPMVTPYLLSAACLGYLTGEFWILGQTQMQDTGRIRKLLRHSCTALAVLILGIVLFAGGWNWRTVNGRSGGRIAAETAREILDRMSGRDVLFVAGVFDDFLRLYIHERHLPVVMINTARLASSDYLREVARQFQEDDLRQPLLQGEIDAFIDKLLLPQESLDKVAIIESPEVFREYGYLVPAGLVYLLKQTRSSVDLKALVAEQRSLWARMEAMARNPLPKTNPARPYQDIIRQLTSMMANNLAVLLLENDDRVGALEILQTARKIYTDNPSVMLNLLSLQPDMGSPEAKMLMADLRKQQIQMGRERWALAIRYGYVWHADKWAEQDFIWALSGIPIKDENARRNNSPVTAEVVARAHFIDLIYLRLGTDTATEETCRGRLMRNERDATALQELCRLALRRNQPTRAKAYLDEAITMGLPQDQSLFDRAIIEYIQGHTSSALMQLEALSRQAPGDLRVWLALTFLAEPQSDVQARASKAIKHLSPTDLHARLSLAELQLSQRHWNEARSELEIAVQMDPKNSKAWELLARAAQAAGDDRLTALCVKTLLNLDPHHPLGYLQLAYDYYHQGNLAEAERLLPQGLTRRRDPELLNGLAHVVMDRQGDTQEIHHLVDEAIIQQPGNLAYRCTRAELDLNSGQIDAAGKDLQAVLSADPGNIPALLLQARWEEASGNRAAAMSVVRNLARRREDLTVFQLDQLKKLLLYLKKS